MIRYFCERAKQREGTTATQPGANQTETHVDRFGRPFSNYTGVEVENHIISEERRAKKLLGNNPDELIKNFKLMPKEVYESLPKRARKEIKKNKTELKAIIKKNDSLKLRSCHTGRFLYGPLGNIDDKTNYFQREDLLMMAGIREDSEHENLFDTRTYPIYSKGSLGYTHWVIDADTGTLFREKRWKDEDLAKKQREKMIRDEAAKKLNIEYKESKPNYNKETISRDLHLNFLEDLRSNTKYNRKIKKILAKHSHKKPKPKPIPKPNPELKPETKSESTFKEFLSFLKTFVPPTPKKSEDEFSEDSIIMAPQKSEDDLEQYMLESV